MATSGSYDFITTRDDIITDALRVLKVVDQDGSATANQITNGATALNRMVKAWRPASKMLWTMDWITQTLTASSEVDGTDSEVYTCIRPHTSAASDTPITGANYSTYWLKRGSTGGTWVTSTNYVSVNQYSLAAEIWSIDNAFIRRANIDVPLTALSREDYLEQANKGVEGKPNSYYFQKRIGQSELYLYTQPENTTDVVHLYVTKLPEDFDISTDNPDFPVEWYDALVYGLADRLSPQYLTDRLERQDVKRDAILYKREAEMGDAEDVDLRISPDIRIPWPNG